MDFACAACFYSAGKLLRCMRVCKEWRGLTTTSLFSFDSPNKRSRLAVSGGKAAKFWDGKHGGWTDVVDARLLQELKHGGNVGEGSKPNSARRERRRWWCWSGFKREHENAQRFVGEESGSGLSHDGTHRRAHDARRESRSQLVLV